MATLDPSLVLQNINNPRPYVQSPEDYNDLLEATSKLAQQNAQTSTIEQALKQKQFEEGLTNPIAAIQAQAALGAAQGSQNLPPQVKAQLAPEQSPAPIIPPGLADVHAGLNANLNPPANPPLQSSVNLPPMVSQAQGQPTIQDRYTPMEQNINQQQSLLDQKKSHIPITSFDPKDPLSYTENLDKANQGIAEEQDKINGQKFQLGVNRAWDAALPGINDFYQSQLAKNGGRLNEGDYNQILGKIESAVTQNPSLAKADGYKDLTTLLEKQKPLPVFNPMMSQARDIPSLRQRSNADAKTYQTSKDALNAAEAEYSNYLKDPNAPTNRVDQQGIIDKYTMVSLGKTPTEAQLQLAQAFPGIDNWFDLASGKLKTGQIVPQPAIDEMMRNMRGTTINYGKTLQQKNAVVKNAAALGGIDPGRVLNTPDDVIDADIQRFSTAPGMPNAKQNYSADVVAGAKAYQALPANDPHRNAVNDAHAKKVLGQ